MSPARWKAGQERRTVLADQTRDLAARLERIGIGAMVQTDHVAISAVTGAVDDVEAFRAVKFLPLIAQRDRRPMLNALRYYQANHEDGEWLRLAVVTAGVVIPAFGPMKATARQLKKNISRWASDADSTYGVHVVFRGVEFTRKRGDEALTGKLGEEIPSLHERDPERFDAETYYYHVHANVLYRPRAGIDKAMWRHFLKWSRMRLGNVAWKDCGKLRKPEEACKYPFKPTELGDLSDDELRWLYHSTFRQNDMQPMGRLKDFRAFLENHVATDDDGKPVLDKDGQPIRERLKVTTVRRKAGARLEIVKKRKPDPRPEPDADHRHDLRPKKRENLVLTVTAPQARTTPWAEPVIMVAGYTAEPTTMSGCDGLATIERVRDEARKAWDANGAPEPEIAQATAEAWRAAKTAAEAEKVVALAEQNRKGARAAGPATFKVHTCRLSAQAPEGGAGDVPPQEAKPPRTPGPRRIEFTEAGEAFDPETGEVYEAQPPAPVLPASAEWVADRLPSTIAGRADRDAVRAANYREWQRAQWRARAASKANPNNKDGS
jgi:hypothetical protein